MVVRRSFRASLVAGFVPGCPMARRGWGRRALPTPTTPSPERKATGNAPWTAQLPGEAGRVRTGKMVVA
jgi:hypothetical protein